MSRHFLSVEKIGRIRSHFSEFDVTPGATVNWDGRALTALAEDTSADLRARSSQLLIT